MKTHTKPCYLLFCLGLLALVACGEGTSNGDPDASEPPDVDAASSVVDAASSAADSAPPAVDAAVPVCVDEDGDGFGVGDACVTEQDCDDTESTTYPGATEFCDTLDNDCDDTEDNDCLCPILTYVCALGCCPSDSEIASDVRAAHSDIGLDASGNVYVSYARPQSTAWRGGFATYTRATATWDYTAVDRGSTRTSAVVSESGRVHHLYAANVGQVAYRYSDDQGATWTPIPGIPGQLAIGGDCSFAVDSQDNPHLMCLMEADNGNRRYIFWTGGAWSSQIANIVAGGSPRKEELHMGFGDRVHLVHTYGPTETDIHYTYYTGTQWEQEPVPLPQQVNSVHPDLHPGSALGANDTAHIGVVARHLDSTYNTWYARRTADGTWTLELALDSALMADQDYAKVYLELDDGGHPVLVTEHGIGARRDSAGNWVSFQTEDQVEALAVHGGFAYVLYPVDGATYYAQRLHLTRVDLTP